MKLDINKKGVDFYHVVLKCDENEKFKNTILAKIETYKKIFVSNYDCKCIRVYKTKDEFEIILTNATDFNNVLRVVICFINEFMKILGHQELVKRLWFLLFDFSTFEKNFTYVSKPKIKG